MLDRTVIAFDIETIPDPGAGRRLFGLEGTDAEVVDAMVRRRLEETRGASEYPQHPLHRVVSICATVLEPEAGTVELRSFGETTSGAGAGERALLEAFFALVTGEHATAPRLVSWNGGGFDLPVMRYRSMLHGVAAPGFYRTDGEWAWNNYQSRYHDLHVDLMDVLSGFGASARVSLGTLGPLVGLPEKAFLERAIYAHALGGELAVVDEYCKLDTLETMLVFLLWGHHCGWVAREQLAELVGAAREAVAREEHPGWRPIAAALAKWPAW